MQEYEDVLKRALSCEMKNFQLFHIVFLDYCDGCRQDYEDLLKTLNKRASSIMRNEKKLSLCFLIIAMVVCKIMKMY